MYHFVTSLVEQPVFHTLYIIVDEAVFFVKDFIDSAFFLVLFVLKSFTYSLENFSVSNLYTKVDCYIVDAQVKIREVQTFITSHGVILRFPSSRLVFEVDLANAGFVLNTRWYIFDCLKIYLWLISLWFSMPILGLNPYLLGFLEVLFQLTDPFMAIWFNKIPAVLGVDIGILFGIHLINLLDKFLLSIAFLTPDGQKYTLWTTGVEIGEIVSGTVGNAIWTDAPDMILYILLNHIINSQKIIN